MLLFPQTPITFAMQELKKTTFFMILRKYKYLKTTIIDLFITYTEVKEDNILIFLLSSINKYFVNDKACWGPLPIHELSSLCFTNI